MKKYDCERGRATNAFGRKLAQARRDAGIAQTTMVELMKEYNISITTPGYSRWEGGFSTPNPYQVFALCMILDIQDPVSFFTEGCGPVRKDGLLNMKGKAKVSEYIDDLIATGKYCRSRSAGEDRTDAAADGEFLELDIYDLPVSAGRGNFIDSESHERIRVPAESVKPGTDFLLKISGDSMEPSYSDGQTVCVKKTDSLDAGDVGIFLYKGEAYIKVLSYHELIKKAKNKSAPRLLHRYIQLVSLNKNYPPILIESEAEFTVIGKVLD